MRDLIIRRGSEWNLSLVILPAVESRHEIGVSVEIVSD
jgi:hypothetical protein